MNCYFDNAATSWPKPDTVYKACEQNLRCCFGNPGRSGHTSSLETDRLIYQTRQLLTDFFNGGNPARIAFALNATDALNMAIKGLLNAGDHVILTAMEHNSVLRPLGGLKHAGVISTTVIPCSREGFPDLDLLKNSFNPRTRMVICNHASNVTGTLLPVKEIARLAHQKGAFFLLDAAQTAGVILIDVQDWEIDLMAFTGHKGLLGPTGTGGLYVRDGIDLKPWREGGTGSYSEIDLHPGKMPERLEAGTLNCFGLAGLREGIKFIQQTGVLNIREHERSLRIRLKAGLEKIPGVTVYGPEDPELCTGVLSFTVEGIDCGELGFALEDGFGILTRSGLHCAPLAHKAIGTYSQGTLRLSPGYFNRAEEIDYLIEAVSQVATLKTVHRGRAGYIRG